jgi:hypothetical protein
MRSATHRVVLNQSVKLVNIARVVGVSGTPQGSLTPCTHAPIGVLVAVATISEVRPPELRDGNETPIARTVHASPRGHMIKRARLILTVRVLNPKVPSTSHLLDLHPARGVLVGARHLFLLFKIRFAHDYITTESQGIGDIRH